MGSWQDRCTIAIILAQLRNFCHLEPPHCPTDPLAIVAGSSVPCFCISIMIGTKLLHVGTRCWGMVRGYLISCLRWLSYNILFPGQMQDGLPYLGIIMQREKEKTSSNVGLDGKVVRYFKETQREFTLDLTKIDKPEWPIRASLSEQLQFSDYLCVSPFLSRARN